MSEPREVPARLGEPDEITARSREIAARLLDAQVAFLLAEVSGERLAEVVARDVAAALAVAETIAVREVISADQAEQSVAIVLDLNGGSPVFADMVGVFAEAIYDRA
ncbi:hypothetical protein [Nocardia panacis]|uniref:hypothetical protein n=1 Tax=Nocardia panacis TaxID=2340916 RepID=UPI001EF03E2A|nr:hypothetical protein [Nocardia panacis]